MQYTCKLKLKDRPGPGGLGWGLHTAEVGGGGGQEHQPSSLKSMPWALGARGVLVKGVTQELKFYAGSIGLLSFSFHFFVPLFICVFLSAVLSPPMARSN